MKAICCIIVLLAKLALSARAQTNLVASDALTNFLLWPTMRYEDFMADDHDEANRRQLWYYFIRVEREAKRFAGTSNQWETLKAVTLGSGGPMWYSGGTIRLGPTPASECGAMFHEIFHNTFNGSQFRNGGDNAWSEAFCDAFRYMIEKKYLPEPRTGWFMHLNSFTNQTYDEVMAHSGDKHFDQTYFYPASLIIRKVGGDLEKFRLLSFALQQQRAYGKVDVLNAYFGYDMQNGRPIKAR